MQEESDQIQQRRKKLDELREMGVDPYPPRYTPEDTSAALFSEAGELTAEEVGFTAYVSPAPDSVVVGVTELRRELAEAAGVGTSFFHARVSSLSLNSDQNRSSTTKAPSTRSTKSTLPLTKTPRA